LKRMKLTGGPGLSAGEREGGKGVAGWTRPKERRGRGGGVGPKGRGWVREKALSSSFFKTIFQIPFRNELE